MNIVNETTQPAPVQTTETQVAPQAQQVPPLPQAPQFEKQQRQYVPKSWKEGLNPDLRNSPTIQKFDDSQEGLMKAIEAHLNLEKLLGHDKVPIPKGPDDHEGLARFRKAMGIPSDPNEYKLPDVDMPKGMKENLPFNKEQFANIMAKNNATPDQAAGMWTAYTELSKQAYQKAMQGYQTQVDEAINKLRFEWGDAYESNVDLGQNVIGKFSEDQETNDFITSTLARDPRGIKFLQSIGEQFAENKIGEFHMKKYSMSPSEAQEEWDKVSKDPDHAYNNPKATNQERQAAIDYVNQMISIINKQKQAM